MRTRLLSLVLLVAVAVGCLSSCGIGSAVSTEEMLERADAALKEGGYTATSVTELSAADPDLADKLESLEGASITYSVVRDDFKASMSVAVGDAGVERKYVVKNGVLYVESVASVGAESLTTRKKCEIDEAQIAELMAELGAGAELTHKDFENVEREGTSPSSDVITCTGIKAESIAGAEQLLGSAALGAGYTITLKDVSYSIFIYAEKYSSTVLTYTYSVATEGALYNMTASLITEYTYPADLSVDAPADADAYKSTDYENALK